MEKYREWKENREYDKTYVDVNDMISVELIRGGDEELWIHIDDVRDYELSEKLSMLRSGLQKLAFLLETDERLMNVKVISGTSWIVKEHPKLIKSLGFEIADTLENFPWQKKEYDNRKDVREEEFKESEGAHAYISRDKFLEIYKIKRPEFNKKVA